MVLGGRRMIAFIAGAAAGAGIVLAIWWLVRNGRARSAKREAADGRPRPLPESIPGNLRLEIPEGSVLRLHRDRQTEASKPTPDRAAPSPSDETLVPGPAIVHLELEGVIRAWTSAVTEPAVTPERRRAIRRLLARARGAPEAWLLVLAVVVYLLIRLIRLADFPIYFFTDEAIQSVLASDLAQAGFRDHLGHYFPTYLLNVYYFNLSTTVYAQLIPTLLLGKAVFLTRAVAVFLTLPGALAVGLTLKQVFRMRHAWLGVLLLSLTPAWFLHSRTAFETTAMVSFYACFLYFYLLYRLRSPAYLYLAVVCAGLAFYSYASGQIIVTFTAFLLGLADVRYHWAHRRTVARALLLAILVAAPFVRFLVEQPDEVANALRSRASVWTEDLPLWEKVRESGLNYARALSPAYWYFPNRIDLSRHVMRGYGHISLWTLPFALAGLLLALKNWRNPAHRAVLLAILATASAAAAAGVGVTRVLSFVVPVVWLTALGLEAALAWVARRVPGLAAALGLFAVLAGLNFAMLRDSLINGPTWFDDYGLDGMQYGARQVFAAIEEVLAEERETEIRLTPSWANGTDVLARFFLRPTAPVIIENADGILSERRDLTERMLFILTPDEYARAAESPILTDVRVERTLPYPDGRPGFFFVRMRYSPEAGSILAQAEAERLQPVVEEVRLEGQVVQVTHPLFEMGTADLLFDADPQTLVRTYQANPARITLDFPQPRRLSALALTLAFPEAALTVRLFTGPEAEPITYSQEYHDLDGFATIEMEFESGPVLVSRIEIEIRDLLDPIDAKIHLGEIILR